MTEKLLTSNENDKYKYRDTKLYHMEETRIILIEETGIIS